MTVSATTLLSYPLSDFTTSGGTVNSQILKQELEDAGLTVLQVAVSGPNCIVTLSGDASSSDITTSDGVVAAHDGGTFDSTLQKNADPGEESDDTGDEVVKCTLSVGPLPKGTYLCTYGMEVSLTTDGGTATGARAFLKVNKNSAGLSEAAQHNTSSAFYSKFAEAYMLDVLDGDTYAFQLSYQRVGTSGNAAKAQRARIGWVKLD